MLLEVCSLSYKPDIRFGTGGELNLVKVCHLQTSKSPYYGSSAMGGGRWSSTTVPRRLFKNELRMISLPLHGNLCNIKSLYFPKKYQNIASMFCVESIVLFKIS